MSIKRTILLYYVAIILSAMIIGGFYPFATSSTIIQNLFFLPIVVFMWINVNRINRQKLSSVDQSLILFKTKIFLFLLIYSILVVLIMTVGAFINIRSFSEAVADILFLPVAVQFLLWFFPLFNKKAKKS